MRYHLIGEKNDELIIDLRKTKKHSQELCSFDFALIKDNKIDLEQTVYIRQLAGKYYYSEDQVKWKRIAKQFFPTELLHINKRYQLHRGFKPSGAMGSSSGELKTQMPGKVVKILVEKGAQIKMGQTVVILEAMKMENEINADCDGVIKEIYVKEGDAIESGVMMLEISKED